MTHNLTAVSCGLQQAFLTSPHFAGRRLQIDHNAGRVVLKGTVSSYFQKQMAQETARRVDGVHEIENQLEVAWR